MMICLIPMDFYPFPFIEIQLGFPSFCKSHLLGFEVSWGLSGYLHKLLWEQKNWLKEDEEKHLGNKFSSNFSILDVLHMLLHECF